MLLHGGTNNDFRQFGQNIRFQHVPFGLYDMEVQATGFETRRERIAISQQEVQLLVGLLVPPPHEEAPSQIVGTIETKAKDVWVLVPLYSGGLAESQLTESGTFALSGIQPGRYILLVLSHDKLLATKEIEFFGGTLKLHLDLTK